MSKRGVKVNSIKGLKKIRRERYSLFVNIRRDGLVNTCISDLTISEFIDVLIGWTKQKRRI